MYKYFAVFILGCAVVCLWSGCISTNSAYTRIPPGIWRGVLVLEKFNIPVNDKDTVILLTDQFKPGELPFNFEVKYLDDERFYVEIINGQERIRCDSIVYGRNRYTARDTVNIYFPEYESYLHVDVRGGVMQGEWVVTSKTDYRIPFYAHSGRDYRFTSLTTTPEKDISGEWAALFGVEQETQDKAIAEFVQKGNHLEGTFRTETGDYRFLEGTVQGRKFWLSCFDGAHAYLFSGSIKGDTLQGEFRSGKNFQTLWTAWRDPGFKLGNPDSLTTLKAGGPDISFNMTTPEGKTLQFPGPAFDNKIKIFTIMGTWCPNCRDEQVFLREFFKNNPAIAAETAVVGFSFERHKDAAKANAQLLNYKKKMDIPFDLVYAGLADKTEAGKVFPALEKVIAFPTMIILDKSNRIRLIHTGFDGPATSKYGAFQQEFTELIKKL